jgi:hypothetical protein
MMLSLVAASFVALGYAADVDTSVGLVILIPMRPVVVLVLGFVMLHSLRSGVSGSGRRSWP